MEIAGFKKNEKQKHLEKTYQESPRYQDLTVKKEEKIELSEIIGKHKELRRLRAILY